MAITMMPHTLLVDALVQTAHKMYQSRLSRGTSGNISCRTPEGMLITASGYALEEIEPNTICHLKLDGTTIEETRRPIKPSSEWLIHKAVYESRPGCHAVLHAHPMHATLLAGCHRSIDKHIIAESAYYLGQVPLVPYLLPGSHALAQEIGKAVKDSHCLFLANHGVVVIGENLRQAYYQLELLETISEMLYKASQLEPGPVWLNEDQIAELEALKHDGSHAEQGVLEPVS